MAKNAKPTQNECGFSSAGLPTYNALYAFIAYLPPSFSSFDNEKGPSVPTVAGAAEQLGRKARRFLSSLLNDCLNSRTERSFLVVIFYGHLSVSQISDTVSREALRALSQKSNYRTPSQGLRGSR
jgi:hypothetical protein